MPGLSMRVTDRYQGIKAMFRVKHLNHHVVTVLMLLAAFALAGCAPAAVTTTSIVQGSGVSKTEERAVTGVNAVALTTVGQLNVQQASAESLTITADDNILPLLKTTVANGVLTIASEGSFDERTPIVYTLTVREIGALRNTASGEISAASLNAAALEVETSGSGSIQLGALSVSGQARLVTSASGAVAVESLQSESLDIESSGAGNLSATGIETAAVSARLSGSGSVTLSGSAPAQNIAVEGDGDFNGELLDGVDVIAKTSGSGSAIVSASATLDATISGSGSVRYAGSPEVTANDSGAGEVAPLS